MQILFKFKLFVIAISLLISGHAPWGQHEVYRQMHMLLMCSKNDNGAFEFTKNIANIFDIYLPEAKAKVARARDGERLANLLITNQIPLAIVSNYFLVNLQKSDLSTYKKLLKTSNTIYTFKKMSLISNNDFPDEHVTYIAEALSKASQDNYGIAKFIKKEKLTINYNQIVFKIFKL